VDVAQEEAFRGLGGLTTAGADMLPGMVVRNVEGAAGRVAQAGDLRGAGHIASATTSVPALKRRVSPLVRVETPSVQDGDADPTAIAREIRQRMAAIRGCYERGLKRNPQLGGKLVLRIAISGAGTVTAVDVDDDTVDDPLLADCLAGADPALRLRRPRRGAGGDRVSVRVPAGQLSSARTAATAASSSAVVTGCRAPQRTVRVASE
jgi:hypothetical protein